MEKIRNLWETIKNKLDEDPLIKKAAIGGALMLVAIILMVGIKALKSDPSSQTQPATVVSSPATPVAAAMPTAAVTQAPATSAVNPEQIVSVALKPATAALTMVPGFVMNYAYAVGTRIENQSVFANVASVEKSISSFQFLAKPDQSIENQILPGEVILETKATGYFMVDKQSSPLLNVLVNSGSDTRKIQVFVDDQIMPAADNVASGGYGNLGNVSLPIVQAYAPGLHRLTVVMTTVYNTRAIQTAVRVSIKRDTDSAPVDLQVLRDGPIVAAIADAAPSLTQAPSTPPSAAVAPVVATTTFPIKGAK